MVVFVVLLVSFFFGGCLAFAVFVLFYQGLVSSPQEVKAEYVFTFIATQRPSVS